MGAPAMHHRPKLRFDSSIANSKLPQELRGQVCMWQLVHTMSNLFHGMFRGAHRASWALGHRQGPLHLRKSEPQRHLCSSDHKCGRACVTQSALLGHRCGASFECYAAHARIGITAARTSLLLEHLSNSANAREALLAHRVVGSDDPPPDIRYH